MTDILASLVQAKSNSSQESFQSSFSQSPAGSVPTSTSPFQNSPPQAMTQTQALGFQAAGLPICDIDLYLADPRNGAVSAQPPNQGNKSQHENRQQASNLPEPVSLGSKTNHYMATLNTLCQTKGITPVLEIDGDPLKGGFGGVLRLGEATVTSQELWRSKKEAREYLAEKGLDVVKTIEAKTKQPHASSEAGKNWVGMLIEYHNLIDPSQGPTFNEYALGSSFACECIIPSRPNQPFGSKTDMFSSKKAARISSAKQAVEHLIALGELNADGSTKAKKKIKLGAAVRMEDSGLRICRDSPYVQKVNEMFPLLGLITPQYHMAPASTLAPTLWSGYASFPGQPGMPEEIGKARHVFGKKNAKEEIAKGVWGVLLELARKRGVKVEEMDGSDYD